MSETTANQSRKREIRDALGGDADSVLPKITRLAGEEPANEAPVRKTPIPEEMSIEEEFVAAGAIDPTVAPTSVPAPARPKKPARDPAPAPSSPADENGGEQIIRHKPKRKPKPAEEPAAKKPRQTGAMLLHTHRLKKVYDGRAVVNGVEINVREGEIVGLLGPNGAGKTTSFYMIVGLIQPNGGSVVFNGSDMTTEPMYKRARLGMGYLPQEESIFRKLTVEQNIMAVLETQKGLNRRERRERCQSLMEQFGIEKLANNLAITLSGGEKRRLTIARSLVTNPKLLMLDEPFSGVDPIAVEEIKQIVSALREEGLAILITDHNVQDTLDIVDRAYLLYEGVVRREGPREFLINDPLSRELYLGSREY